LNIRLLHRGVGDPPPGGLIERFFRTVQDQLEAELRAGPPLTLERLNQALKAWLEVSYHERPNSETQQSPRLRYEQGLAFTRHVDLQQVMNYFLQRERRKVDPTFSDVRLQGRFFRVDPQLRGDWVEVRYDPFTELETVFLYSLEDEYLGLGQRYHREGPAIQPLRPRGPDSRSTTTSNSSFRSTRSPCGSAAAASTTRPPWRAANAAGPLPSSSNNWRPIWANPAASPRSAPTNWRPCRKSIRG